MGSVISCTLRSRHESTRLRLIPKFKWTYAWKRFFSLKELSTNGARAIRQMNKSGVLDGIIMLPKRWNSIIEKQGKYIEGLWTDHLKEIKVLVKKYRVGYITFEMDSV